MSSRYVLSAHAQDDRDGIFEYTTRRSGDLEVALRFDQTIEDTLEAIAAIRPLATGAPISTSRKLFSCERYIPTS